MEHAKRPSSGPGPVRGSLRRLFSHLSVRRRWQLSALMLLMMAGAAAEMLTLGAVVPVLALLADPAAAAQYPRLQALLGPGAAGPGAMLRWTAGFFAVVALLAAALRMGLFWASYRFTFGVGADLGGAVYRRTLHRPYSWHVARNSSEIVAAIEKVNSVTNSVIVQLVQGGVALLLSAGILATLLAIDAKTALIAGAGFSLLYGLTTLVTRPRLRRNARAIAANRTQRVRCVQEGLGGIRDVLLDGTQDVYHRRFAQVDNEMRRAQAGNAFMGASPRVFMEASGVVLIMGVAYALSSRQGGVSQALPVLGALALGAQKLLPQMQQVYYAWTAVTGNRGELDDVLALLDSADPAQAPARDSQPPQAPRPSPGLGEGQGRPLIALRGLGFRYDPEAADVLHTINLDIPAGMRIGIVGSTGSGKSTLIDIIMGLLAPTDGHMEIEGQVLAPANLRAWQSRIAHVPQAIYLSDATIAENIALGTPRERIDRHRLEVAARQAQLAEFIERLPQAYDTVVGERGVRLSGGQRQRIGLARALYKQADVLVLDEATSALDNLTEQEVISALDALPDDRTIFMIAHRLTTVQTCDRILLLDKGRVVGFDSWDGLAARSAAFRQIASIRPAERDLAVAHAGKNGTYE